MCSAVSFRSCCQLQYKFGFSLLTESTLDKEALFPEMESSFRICTANKRFLIFKAASVKRKITQRDSGSLCQPTFRGINIDFARKVEH